MAAVSTTESVALPAVDDAGSAPLIPTFARRRWLYAAELILVVVLSVFSARTVLQMGPDLRVRGQEFSYLIGSGALADILLDATGGIPLWNSWMGRGEPLLENSFSYVNNPLMTLPVVAWGMYDGAKIAVALHAALAGIGGWLLGYIIGLGTGGRLLSAFLFAGSGGMVGAIGMGFYQMSLSQTYVPWVYAGLLGVLRRNDRWTLGVFVVATSLLIFSGTFWYVLPTAIGCTLLIAFNVINRTHEGGWKLNRTGLRRLILATGFLILVSATRLMPQFINHAYVSHNDEFFPNPAREFGLIAGRYFTTELPAGLGDSALFYFYTIAPVFFAALAIGRLIIVPVGGKTPKTWRVVIPAALGWFLFTTWAQEGGAFWVWLYETVPLLKQWRFVTRMLAAGAPFLILIAAIWYDDLLKAILTVSRAPGRGRAGRLAGMALFGVLAIGGAVVAVDSLTNWQRQSDVEPVGRDRTEYLQYLRTSRPDEMISLQEWTFFGYFDFYELLLRTATGNPDYRASGLEPTLGTVEMMNYLAPEALEYDDTQARWLEENGYEERPSPADIEIGTLWVNPSIPPYAFSAPESAFAPNRTERLRADEVTPIAYDYQLDRIGISMPGASGDEVLVVTETAYPGWQVTLNGDRAPLESVGGLIGVHLPGSTEPIAVEFAYRPTIWYASSFITLFGAALMVLYLLRADRWLVRKPARSVPAAVVGSPALAPALAPASESAVIPAAVSASPETTDEPAPAPVAPSTAANRGWLIAIVALVVTALAGAVAIVGGVAGWLLVRRRTGTD